MYMYVCIYHKIIYIPMPEIDGVPSSVNLLMDNTLPVFSDSIQVIITINNVHVNISNLTIYCNFMCLYCTCSTESTVFINF